MVEKKLDKPTVKATKPRSTQKVSRATEQKKKATATSSRIKKTSKPKEERTLEVSFTPKKTRKIERNQIEINKDKRIPAWIMVLFLFSLVFFLFALYKAFIYGQGYHESESIDVSSLYDEPELSS